MLLFRRNASRYEVQYLFILVKSSVLLLFLCKELYFQKKLFPLVCISMWVRVRTTRLRHICVVCAYTHVYTVSLPKTDYETDYSSSEKWWSVCNLIWLLRFIDHDDMCWIWIIYTCCIWIMMIYVLYMDHKYMLYMDHDDALFVLLTLNRLN